MCDRILTNGGIASETPLNSVKFVPVRYRLFSRIGGRPVVAQPRVFPEAAIVKLAAT
jgi:hypothetical protein